MTLDEAIKHAEEMAEEQEGRGYCDRSVCVITSSCDECEVVKCRECAKEHYQLSEWLKELQAHKEAWEKCIKEIKEWYWDADKQSIAKDPCVVDAMVDLFIRTIKECRPKEGENE